MDILGAQIEKCTNMTLKEDGYIKANAYVGGITGINYVMGNVDNSINSAKIIVLGDNAGGIVGVNNANISNCYNKGNIDASNCDSAKVGGICGQNISDSYINSSYNIGKIDYKLSADGVIGADFGTTSNCYYLDSSINIKNNLFVKTQDELKKAILDNLSDFYKEDKVNANNGFPILNWEASE